MPEEKVSLILQLKDGISAGLAKVQAAAAGFAQRFENSFKSAIDTIEKSQIATFTFANILASALTRATGIVKQFVTDSISNYQEFSKTLANVYTLLDEDAFERFGKRLKAGALQVLRDYTFSIQDVNKALFDAISAGIDAGNATEFLNQAARLATGGVTQIGVAVDGMTSIINAYGLEQDKANRVADAFFTAQKFGKTTVEELASTVGTVAPIAAQAGISFEELLSSMAELTLAGISTDRAATALKASIIALISPAADAQKKFTELGIPFGKTALEGGNFARTLGKIAIATDGNIDKVTELIPNVEALLGVTSLATEKGLKKYDEIVKAVRDDTTSLTGAFQKQREESDFIIKQYKNELLIQQQKLGFYITEFGITPLIKFTQWWRNLQTELLNWFAKIPLVETAAKKISDVFGLTTNAAGKNAESVKNASEANVKSASKEAEELAAIEEKKTLKAEIEEAKRIAAAKKAQAEKEKADKNRTAQEDKRLEQEAKKEKEKQEREAKRQAEKEAEQRKELELFKRLELNGLEFERALEEQRKEFAALNAEERRNRLIEELGERRVLEAEADAAKLIEKGKYDQAQLEREKLFSEAFKKINQEKYGGLLVQAQVYFEKILFGHKLNAEQRKLVETSLSDFVSNIFTILGDKSKEVFEIQKAISIVQTIISTYEGAQKAFTSLAGIPVVGPALGVAAAAAAIGAGIARVNQIRQQRMPAAESGALVRGSAAGTALIAGENFKDEMVLPFKNPRAMRELNESGFMGGGKNIVVNINLAGHHLGKFVVALNEQEETMREQGLI